MVASIASAGFIVQGDGVWLHVESPDGRRAAINLSEIVGDSSEVGEVFREWSEDLVIRHLCVDA